MAEFVVNDYGYKIKATIYEADGKTPKDLTGLTPTLQLEDVNDITQHKTLVGTVTAALTGKLEFTVTQNFFTVVTTWKCRILFADSGTSYRERTKQFIINIVEDTT